MMAERRLEFPPGFLWGVATAAHQNEGSNTKNDFWAWEQTPGHIVDGTTSGLAADWWNRAEEDFDRAAEMGLNALRLSVEWSRIEPRPNVWSGNAFDRYREMLTGLRARGIEPMITLHHFTNPMWLAEMDGWASPEVVPLFRKFVARVVDKLGDLCHLWCTINEPNIYGAMAYVVGKWSPGKKSLPQFIRVTRNQIRAHAAAYHAIHRHQPHAQVGIVQHMAAFDPLNPKSRRDRATAHTRNVLLNWRVLDAVTDGRIRFPFGSGRRRHAPDTTDFIGLNYYGRHPLRFAATRPGTLFSSEVQAAPELAWAAPWTDREIYPEGLERFAKALTYYKKPIYITENGFAEVEDEIRPAFILTHLAALHRAIQAGADVRGYFYWTLVDNYEWAEGWTTPFGLIALNPETQERTYRRSAELYSEIARANAITEDIIEKYAPHCVEQVFR